MSSHTLSKTVTLIIIVYGNRFPFVKQVAERMLADSHVTHFVIADNRCHDQAGLAALASSDARVHVLAMGGNVGYGPAAHEATLFARTTGADYMLILDDDSIPDVGAIDDYLSLYQFFTHDKIIIAGNRVDVPGSDKIFTRGVPKHLSVDGTIFEVFSMRKVANFIRLIRKKAKKAAHPFVPIIPVTAFVTGGTFIPMQAVLEVDPLDNTFFVYGEDLDYAWRLRKAGYEIYQSARPIIHELDMTFPGNDDAHIWGLWSMQTPDYKVYFRLRNSIIISRRHTYQSKPVLLANIAVWMIGLLLIGLLKRTAPSLFMHRVRVIWAACKDGYAYPHTKVPEWIEIPR